MDSSLAWAETSLSVASSVTFRRLELRIPTEAPSVRLSLKHQADQLCLDYLYALREALSGPMKQPLLGERGRTVPAPCDRFRDARSLLYATPIYPARKAADAKPRAAFVVPVASYGGVEQVAYSMAREFRACGYETRLIVVGGNSFEQSPRNADCFDEITIVPEATLLSGSDGTPRYMGQNLMPATQRDLPHIRGLLHDLDVFVNCHSSHLDGLVGELRRNGCVTVSSVHVRDKTGFGRDVGHPYFSLAYEHAYDLYAPCSESMGNWLKGMGVPPEKVVPVVNAADLTPKTRQPREGALRVLILGRFDYQKGLDRFEAVVKQTRQARHGIQWNVVGSSLLEDLEEASGLSDIPNITVERPVYDPEELAGLFAKTDVLLLLSRWEGLPLTLLEAMRCGVVPVATDVGAVSELVVDGENGFLLGKKPGSQQVASDASESLGKLAQDNALWASMSRAATKAVEARDWSTTTTPLISECGKLLA